MKVTHCRGMRSERTEERARQALVSEQAASGQSVAAFCRDRGLRDWQFYEWKKRIREPEVAKFVAVQVAAVEGPVSVTFGKAIEVRLPRGRSVVVEPGFDAHHLRVLLSVLEKGT